MSLMQRVGRLEQQADEHRGTGTLIFLPAHRDAGDTRPLPPLVPIAEGLRAAGLSGVATYRPADTPQAVADRMREEARRWRS